MPVQCSRASGGRDVSCTEAAMVFHTVSVLVCLGVELSIEDGEDNMCVRACVVRVVREETSVGLSSQDACMVLAA